jgi:PAS domain-containing protein
MVVEEVPPQGDRVGDDEIMEAGVYTWLLSENLLYGDTLVAFLFGLDPAQTTRGLAIEAYLERVHKDDIQNARALINTAVLDGLPYQTEYRVMDLNGEYHRVIALGRCFQDRNMMPVIYSGIVYPTSQLE